MNKNLVLAIVGIIVVCVIAATATLIGVKSLDASIGIPIISSVVTLVLGALLAILDPKS